MRSLARKPVVAKGVTIGGESPLVCVPVVAQDEQALLEQARKNVAVTPDLIEWRADFFTGVTNPSRLQRALGLLSQTIGDIPLIFTCRAFAEGGAQAIDHETRLSIIETVVKSGVPSLVDVELSSGEPTVSRVTQMAGEHGLSTILSFHDFKATPPVELIKDKLVQAQSAGGDIAKVAVMPRSYTDVLDLFRANLMARDSGVDIPIITMAMGKMGVISRLAGWLFGSDVTFAVGEQASAPGQIPIAQLRKGIEILREGTD